MRLTIDPKSVASHPLIPFAYSQPLGQGTGFIVQVCGIHVLVTNYHVIAGRHPVSNRLLDGLVAQPDRILTPLLRRGAGLVWMPTVQPLYDAAGDPLWTVHATFGSRFDVVAFPISVPPEAMVVPAYAVDPGPDISLAPGSEVAIVGFPEGMTASGITAIWKTGSVASEIELPIDGEDYFWIDSNTRRGMSGSPVIARRFGGAMMNDGAFSIGGLVDRLLGVYSGRAFDAPDMTLGKVWHWSAVRPIIDEAVAKVLRGVWTPQRIQIGHIPRAHMVRLEANRTAEVAVTDQAGVARVREVSVGELLLEFALADDRFGVSLERVKMAAGIAAAIAAARAGDGNLHLDDAQYALVREVIQAPLKPYNPVVARQVVELLDHIVNAGQAPPAASVVNV